MSTQKKYIDLTKLKEDLEKKGYIITETVNTSLTARLDVKPDLKPVGKGKKSKLSNKITDDNIEDALNKLTRTFPMVERAWVDPPIASQSHCVFSFVPAKGSTPDRDGLYGMAKVRGVFANQHDAEMYAEKLIQEVDSYHEMGLGEVGHPLPLSRDGDDRYTLETQFVGLQKKLQEELADDVKERRKKEKKEIDEAQVRAKKNQEKENVAIAQGHEDPEEKYTTLRVKRANLIFSVYEMIKTIKKYKDTLLQTIETIDEMDVQYPEFQKTFLANYNKAAEDVGIPTEKNFILKYLVGPVPFSMSLIPDELPLIDLPNPGITSFDDTNVDARTTATEISMKASAGDKSLEMSRTVPFTGIMTEGDPTKPRVKGDNEVVITASKKGLGNPGDLNLGATPLPLVSDLQPQGTSSIGSLVADPTEDSLTFNSLLDGSMTFNGLTNGDVKFVSTRDISRTQVDDEPDAETLSRQFEASLSKITSDDAADEVNRLSKPAQLNFISTRRIDKYSSDSKLDLTKRAMPTIKEDEKMP